MGGRANRDLKNKKGFSLVELLIAIFVIGVLATLVTIYVVGSREKSYFTRANAEFTSIENALKLYVAKNNDYPAEVNYGMPSGLQEFLTKDSQGQDLENAPYPNSYYDYENWLVDDANGDPVATRQISIRFCPEGAAITNCHFPNEDWAEDFNVLSALYYCIEGLCRSHHTQPAAYPGYCVNCPNNQGVGP